MSKQVLSDETRAEMRRQATNPAVMHTTIREYCPTEFIMLLDEYEMLLKAVQTLQIDEQRSVYDEIADMRAKKVMNE